MGFADVLCFLSNWLVRKSLCRPLLHCGAVLMFWAEVSYSRPVYKAGKDLKPEGHAGKVS